MKSLPRPPWLQVATETLPRGQRVVAVAALEHVVTVGVEQDVVAEAADVVVVAVSALHPVVAVVAADGVVTLAGPDAVVAGGAVEDDVLRAAVADRAVRHPGEQGRLVPLVAGSSRTAPDVPRLATSKTNAGRENESAGRPLDVRVALDQLGERVALELRQHVQASGPGQVVEPVAELQVLHLRLEDVVERRAEQTAEDELLLGEPTDPQVDAVHTGVGRVRPGRPSRSGRRGDRPCPGRSPRAASC